jgi:hypothetical protein
MEVGSPGNLSRMPDVPTLTAEIDAGPPPPSEDDWGYMPRLSRTLDALEIEIVEEGEEGEALSGQGS